MRYILDQRYRFRGWQKAPYGIYDTIAHKPRFLPPEVYPMVLRFDGAHDLEPETLTGMEQDVFRELKQKGVIHPAGLFEFLKPEQHYQQYPARYKREAHWSITGACNLRCRHCFMSAPQARHGNPTQEQLMQIADQLAECGVFQVGITGGEPLIRGDFLDLVRALHQKEIGINLIYSNGWLIDEDLLDALDEIEGGRKIPFQLSFDGIGRHDFLRGIPGAEEKTIRALKLLRERGHRVSVSMCTHRKNLDTVRESVRLMASLGVSSMKVGSMMSLGEWARPELQDLELTHEERLSFYEQYIPAYFEDDAPLTIMLSGAFSYSPGDREWDSFYVKDFSPEMEDKIPSCGSLQKVFYIGAEGVVSPCMGMADCTFAKNFPNLFETPLKKILSDSDLMRWCNATIGEVHNGNDQCPDCAFKDRCAGGCRNTALMHGENYYDVDEEACWFFKNHGEERIRAAAAPAFEAYLKRNPPAEKPENVKEHITDGRDCP